MLTRAEAERRTTTAPDGRQVAWSDYGDPRGTPVVLLHGTPGGRLMSAPRSEAYAALGIRLVATDRAGFGGTDALPGRSVLDQADDVLAVLDAVELDSAVLVGGSGGGPHALAVAVRAPERVRAVGVLVGAVPLRPEDVTGQVAFNRGVFAALDDEAALRTHLEQGRRTILDDGLEALMGDAPAADRAARAALGDALQVALADALAPGIEGMVDDFLALWRRPWGFAPEEVAGPVVWAHGTGDVNVPYAVAADFARRLPDVDLVTWEGVGHTPTPDLLVDFLQRVLAAGAAPAR